MTDAREIALGPRGIAFVGSGGAGKVYALTGSPSTGVADRVRVIARGLDAPVGVVFRNGDLCISEISRIVVLRDIEHHLDSPPAPAPVTDRLPTETLHGANFNPLRPYGKLYVPTGPPCNICEPGPDHGKLIRMNPDGSGLETVARAIRNAGGFDWQPGTQRLWFTDNGRDLIGDDMPSGELNQITRTGEPFGYPYCHQGDTLDPEFGKGKRGSDSTRLMLKLGADVASLHMRFYEDNQFPPRQCAAAMDGSVLVSDDEASAVYRVTRQKP